MRDELEKAVERAIHDVCRHLYDPERAAKEIIPIVAEACAGLTEEVAALWGQSGSPAIEAATRIRTTYGSKP